LEKSIELAESDTAISLTMNDPSKCVRFKGDWCSHPRPLGNFCGGLSGIPFKSKKKIDEEYLDRSILALVPYRGENGVMHKKPKKEVLDMFNKEQEEILKTIPSIKLQDLISHLLSKDDFEKVEATRSQH